MKFIIAFSLVLFSFNTSAVAQDVDFSPEFSKIESVFESMTPEQREAVLANAKKVQAQLEQMSESERNALYRQALSSQSSLDLKGVDVQKLDTNQGLDVLQIQDLMDSQ